MNKTCIVFKKLGKVNLTKILIKAVKTYNII
jgi:hypothetical protein